MTLDQLVDMARKAGVTLDEARQLELVGISKAEIRDGKIYFFKKAKPQPG